MDDKRLTVYDSGGKTDPQVIHNLWKFLKNEYGTTNNESMPSGWVYRQDGRVPQQGNNNDCGVFVCMFADFLTLNLPLVFEQEDMVNIRWRLAHMAIMLHANFASQGLSVCQLKDVWNCTISKANKPPLDPNLTVIEVNV